jgi:3-methyladenine DNA glycosylase/8-oxoguanine DNA glycosylase
LAGIAKAKNVHLLTVEEKTPTPFDFVSTATEHGWVQLRPFEWNVAHRELSRIHRLDSGQVIRMRLQEVNQGAGGLVVVKVETVRSLIPAEVDKIRRVVRRMLRLNEDLSDFYRLSTQLNGWKLRLRPGAGRLLRCPTLFEDMVYTLCTTNIAWSGTIRMVDRLVAHLGESFGGNDKERAFPTAEAIAAAGPEFLKQKIGLGYRSDYVWGLAERVVEGRLDLQRLEDPQLPTDTLQQAFLQVKGVGPYAAATLLMLLGRYEHLAIDTEIRAFVSKKYFNGQPVTDTQIRDIYAPWGRWQYLAYWFDSLA